MGHAASFFTEKKNIGRFRRYLDILVWPEAADSGSLEKFVNFVPDYTASHTINRTFHCTLLVTTSDESKHTQQIEYIISDI